MDVLKGNPANANITATTTTTIATSLTTNTTSTTTTATTSSTSITTSTSTLTKNLIINNSMVPNNSITSTSTNANSNVPSNSVTATTITTTATTTTSSSSLPLPSNNATTLTGLTLANATALLQNLPPLDTGGIKQDDSNNVSLASGISEGQRSLSAAPSASSSPILSPTGKIFGRNANGTMVATSRPNNEAEVQLYRVLQRASLLAYYDTLLEMGGDDVQQLYEAGEEEFLEIMALVGMASKPLHVRRLQKALHEWANNPHQFQTPISNNAAQFDIPAKTTLIFNPDHLTFHCQPRPKFPTFNPSAAFNPTPLINTVPPSTSAHILSQICNLPTALPPQNASLIVPPSPTQTLNTDRGHSLLSNPNNPATAIAPSIGVAASNAAHQVTSSSPQLTPVLSEMQVARIALGAEKISAQLPQREPRAHSSKKRTSRELEQIIAMSEYDPRRMEEIRKYSAIYGRFDCKRRPEKPLTLHEVCVNEAAAQLCRLVPALLTRRDELFPLARQIVKDAGFGHSASIARYGTILNQITQSVLTNTTTSTVVAATTTRSTGTIILDCESTDSNATAIKRQRLSSTDTGGNLTGSDNNRDLNEDCRYNLFAIYQKFAAKAPPFHLTDIAKFSLNKPSTSDCEEQDIESRFSFSNSCSSPPLTSTGLEDDSSPNILDKCCNRSELPTSSIDFFGNNHNCLGDDSCMSSSNIPETNAKRKISLPLPLSGNGNNVSGEVQVVSASGNHIIAVANPALVMSPTLNESISLKRETDSADY